MSLKKVEKQEARGTNVPSERRISIFTCQCFLLVRSSFLWPVQSESIKDTLRFFFFLPLSNKGCWCHCGNLVEGPSDFFPLRFSDLKPTCQLSFIYGHTHLSWQRACETGWHRAKLTLFVGAMVLCRCLLRPQQGSATSCSSCCFWKASRNPWFLQEVCKNALTLVLIYWCTISLSSVPSLSLQYVCKTRRQFWRSQATGSHTCFPSEEMWPIGGGSPDSQELDCSGGQKDQRLWFLSCLRCYFPYSPSQASSLQTWGWQGLHEPGRGCTDMTQISLTLQFYVKFPLLDDQAYFFYLNI